MLLMGKLSLGDTVVIEKVTTGRDRIHLLKGKCTFHK